MGAFYSPMSCISQNNTIIPHVESIKQNSKASLVWVVSNECFSHFRDLGSWTFLLWTIVLLFVKDHFQYLNTITYFKVFIFVEIGSTKKFDSKVCIDRLPYAKLCIR